MKMNKKNQKINEKHIKRHSVLIRRPQNSIPSKSEIIIPKRKYAKSISIKNKSQNENNINKTNHSVNKKKAKNKKKKSKS